MIRWRWQQPTGSGRRTGWARTFTGFDSEARGAKAFTGGEYLGADELREDTAGTLVIEITPEGSVKNGWQSATFCRVGAEGLEPCSEAFDWGKDWLAIKDKAIELLGEQAEPTSDRDRAEAAADYLLAADRLQRVAASFGPAMVDYRRVPALVDEARQCLQALLSNAEVLGVDS